ncbi:hypothetical protein BGX27_009753 [Mortierella sp. AM989]|nr:hypothetical protein BGX27_009753 [Mortierella sp. AM989]
MIHTLSLLDNEPGQYSAIYPRLQSLTLGSSHLEDHDISPEGDPKHMIELNSSLTSLDLKRLDGYLFADFWKTVSCLPSLKSLRVRYTALNDRNDVDAFWNACLNLESLCLTRTQIPGSSGVLHGAPFLAFPRVRILELDLADELSHMEQLNTIRCCPQLEELIWNSIPRKEILELFAEDVTRGQWPNLERLTFGYSNPDVESGRIVDGIQYLSKLDMSFTGFGPHCFRALQRHFGTLKELYLRESSGASSKMLREIMCSCPHLEEFQAGIIKAKDVISDSPWVCLSLKRLEVCFVFTRTEQDLQSKVFERLSKLDRLEKFCVGGWASWRKRSAEEVLDLRLDKGLGVLDKLKNMKHINFYNTTQSLQENDIRWMIANWKQLQEVRGQLNQYSTKNISLMDTLQQHNIQTNESLRRFRLREESKIRN